MPRRLREIWREFRQSEPGQRFQDRYQRRYAQRQAGEPWWHGPRTYFVAGLFVLIAIPLMFTPGPAIIFWALAAFLIAGESLWLARLLDRSELALRRVFRRR
jgi:hypothetical protein